ncbi:MAG TPA: c-type cytochrome, partial [Gemmatimonadaceae bacterium]|nr:c-type cytochrome [Gemmatimonadaceae bacterium]
LVPRGGATTYGYACIRLGSHARVAGARAFTATLRQSSMGTPRRITTRISGAALCAMLALACKGRQRTSANGAADTAGISSRIANVASGTTAAAPVTMRRFTGDTAQASAGRLLFLQENCYGCHGGLAGGAMGPSLRDTVWKYGGGEAEIYNSIHDGRPLGMPAWGKMLSQKQIDELVTYIHSMRTPQEPTFFFWATTGKSKPAGTS